MLELTIVFLSLALDQFSKYLAMTKLVGLMDWTLPVWPGVFDFSYVQNKGAAFGILQGQQVFFAVVAIIASIALVVVMVKEHKKASLFLRITLSLILAGAVGNLIDRVLFGYVRDMFYFRLINFAVFNVADSCLVIGITLLAIYILFFYDKTVAVKKASAGTADSNPNNPEPEEIIQIDENLKNVSEDPETPDAKQ